MQYYITLELGGTNLRYGIVSQDMELVSFEKIPSLRLAQAQDKSGFIYSLLAPLIRQVGEENVLAVSLALSSLMNRERSFVFSSPMVEGFNNIPLKAELQKHIRAPIFLEKDVNILLLYEINQIQDLPFGISIGVFLGTGLGNSICIDKRVYVGQTGSACELGHIPVVGLHQMCSCGKEGCIELLASGKLLKQLADEEYHCDIRDIFTRYGEAAKVKEVLTCFAVAIATEIGILDPAMVIMGGGVVEMEGFPLQAFVKEIRQNLRAPEPRTSVKIVAASGNSRAGVLGAAMHAKTLLGLQV